MNNALCVHFRDSQGLISRKGCDRPVTSFVICYWYDKKPVEFKIYGYCQEHGKSIPARDYVETLSNKNIYIYLSPRDISEIWTITGTDVLELINNAKV